jgi:phosphomannomutase
LHELLAQAERETGHYHWTSVNFPIDMPAAEAHRQLRPLADVRPGQVVTGAGLRRTVVEVNSEDGYKFVFDDGTWLMIRPSGTEPKIRVYGETKQDAAASEALCGLGHAMALDALGRHG